MRDPAGMTSPTERAVLLGQDWIELGEIGRETLGEDVALVNSRGDRAKGYRYVDPNEDVVAAQRLGDGRVVLVCADGHNGEPASRLAVEAILERAEALDGPDALLVAFAAANAAVLEGVTHHRNRTTLSVAVVTDDAAHWASIGDSTLVLLRRDAAPQRFGDPKMHFIGFPMTDGELDARLPRGTVERAPGDRWVLITDGLEEFLAPEVAVERVVGEVAADAPTAAQLADALLWRAFAAGAGDNVAAVVLDA